LVERVWDVRFVPKVIVEARTRANAAFGPQVDGNRVVLTGLKAGDRVILYHLQRLGAPVVPQMERNRTPSAPKQAQAHEVSPSVPSMTKSASANDFVCCNF
jgi:hypothetical protein